MIILIVALIYLLAGASFWLAMRRLGLKENFFFITLFWVPFVLAVCIATLKDPDSKENSW